MVCQKLEKITFFQRNLCYHAFHKTIWLQKEETFRVYAREEVSPTPFLTAVAKVAA